MKLFTYSIVVILLSTLEVSAKDQYFTNEKPKPASKLQKGEAMKILLLDPEADIYKCDKVIFDVKKGTIKAEPAN